MKRYHKLAIGLLLVFLVLAPFFRSIFGNAEVDAAQAKITEAEGAVKQAFNEVLSAEQAGANVTGLLERLSNAADFLAQAEMTYRNGDANTATEKANSVLPIASEVTTQAADAKNQALADDQNALWSNVVFSVLGVAVFILVLFSAWRQLRRSYKKRLFDAKPEVTEFEA